MGIKRMFYLPILGLFIVCQLIQSSPLERSDLEGQLNRVKRFRAGDEPVLTRAKRRDVDDQVVERQKRDNSHTLSRTKRLDETLQRQKRDPDEQVLTRTKREDESLQRMKRLDTNEHDLQRVKRMDVLRKKRDTDASKDTEVKSEVAKVDFTAEKAKRKSKGNKSTKLAKKSDSKVGMPEKRKQGYWEKRSRGDFLIHRANKRGRFHKRRYMKRGHLRFSKKKALLARHAANQAAREKTNEKEFVKKSFEDKQKP